MPRPMTPEMLGFWRELLAPFEDDDLSKVRKAGGKELTYVDKRALSNRLDSVCGPGGWDVEYRSTTDGYTARIGIECPRTDGTWAWNYKEDGGGEEGMTKKVGNENVEDTDNNDKSAYTNAFRRSAQDAWGIGRYLYGKGIPTFLRDDYKPAAAGPVQAAPPRRDAIDPAPTTAPRPAQATPPPPAATQPRRFELGYIPDPGNGVYPWIMEVQKHFHESLWPGVKADAEAAKFPVVASAWNHDQVATLLSAMIRYIKKLPHYKGEFESVALTAEPARSELPNPSADEMESEALRQGKAKLLSAVKLLCERRLGPGATKPADLIAAIGSIAASCTDMHGHGGEVLDSLKNCKDSVWVENMNKHALALLAKPDAGAEGSAGDDDIPF